MKRIQTILIGVLWTFLLPALFSGILFAHGEDEPAGTETVAPAGQMNVKVTQSDRVEILVKYPTPKPTEEITLLIFLTDLQTNTPIGGADVSLAFSQTPSPDANTLHAAAQAVSAKASPTDTPGMYQAKVSFPESGQYNLDMKLAGENLPAAVNIAGLEVLGTEAQTEVAGIMDRSLPLAIAAVLLYILAGVMSYLFWIRPRWIGRASESKPLHVAAEEHKG